MKLSRVIFAIAAIIVGVWVLGLLFKLAAWVIDSLLYIAALVLIIGLISMYLESRKKATQTKICPNNSWADFLITVSLFNVALNVAFNRFCCTFSVLCNAATTYFCFFD